MKKIFLSYLLFLLVFASSNAQVMDWTFLLNENHSAQDVDIHDATIDSSSNLYIAGRVTCVLDNTPEQLDLNPNGSPYLITYTDGSAFQKAEFIVKYNSSQVLQWAIQIEIPSYQLCKPQVFADANGCIFVAGGIGDSIDYDPGPNYVTLGLNSPMELFIAKYDSNGSFLALNKFRAPTLSHTTFYQLSRFDSNSIYIYSADSLFLFDNNLNLISKKPVEGMPVLINDSGFYTLNGFKHREYSYGVTNAYAQVKFDTLGLYHYSKNCDLISRLIVGQAASGLGVAFTSNFLVETKSSKIILSGDFWGDASFGQGINSTIVSNYDSSINVTPNTVYYNHNHHEYHAEIDTGGNLIWIKEYPIPGPLPADIVIDNSNSIYFFGHNTDGFIFDPNDTIRNYSLQKGFYLAKYDSSLNFIESYQFNEGSYANTGRFKLIYNKGIAFGDFLGSSDLDFTSGTYSPSGEGDFVSQYSNFPTGIPSLFSNPNHSFIKAGPNPSTGVFNLRFDEIVSSGQLSIFNSIGQLVYSQVVNGESQKLDISAFSPGLYTVNLNYKEKNASVRLIKSTE